MLASRHLAGHRPEGIVMNRYLAELVGTFVLVFGGVGSAVLAGEKIGFLGVAVAFGLALLAMVYVIGPISGCHVNPAVTIGLVLTRKFSARHAIGYIVAQILGAILAAGVVLLIAKGAPAGYDPSINGLGANGFLEHSPGGYGLLAAFVVEVVLTAFLVLTVLGATDVHAPVGFRRDRHRPGADTHPPGRYSRNKYVGQSRAQHRASPLRRRLGHCPALVIHCRSRNWRRSGGGRLPGCPSTRDTAYHASSRTSARKPTSGAPGTRGAATSLSYQGPLLGAARTSRTRIINERHVQAQVLPMRRTFYKWKEYHQIMALRQTSSARLSQRRSNGAAMGNSTQKGAGRPVRRDGARPLTGQRGPELQAFGSVTPLPNGLDPAQLASVTSDLNQLLADTMTLRDLYKKHHWQVAGPTFYQLHLLFDKHYEEQVELVDLLAERIQILGGISLAMAPDVAETTRIQRPPRGREEVPVQISRLLEAHELILTYAHRAAKNAEQVGDDGTNDLLVSSLIRSNEMQVWFISEHLVDMPLVRAN